jgi:hypothetical protein
MPPPASATVGVSWVAEAAAGQVNFAEMSIGCKKFRNYIFRAYATTSLEQLSHYLDAVKQLKFLEK